jgi:hypothetical protein
MGCGRSKPAAAPAPTNAPAPAPPPARTLTQEETELINNLTINSNNGAILEGIVGVIGATQNDPIFTAKSTIFLSNINQLDYNSFKIELKRRVTNEIISKNISITMQSLQEIVGSSIRDLISSRTTNSFTSDQATYFNSLIQSVGTSLDQYGDPDNRPTDFNSYFINKLYTVARSNPRPPISSAATSVITDITTRFNLTLNTAATTTEETTVAGFQNKNSFIMKELEKIKRNSKGSTETFRNKEVKENCFTGYNLEHNPLLPKEYADF